METLLRRLLAHAIALYQRHLSPRKGYSCAWRVAHGGPSCSEAVKAIVLEQPMREVWPAVKRRFAVCAEAGKEARANKKSRSDDTPGSAGEVTNGAPTDGASQSKASNCILPSPCDLGCDCTP